MWVRVKALIEVHTAIVTWLALPLEKLAVNDLNGDFELAGTSGQSLRLRFEGHKGISLGHQGVSVAVVAAFKTDASFSTDPSCLQQFAAELAVTIDEYR